MELNLFKMACAYLSLGSNKGDRLDLLRRAVAMIQSKIGSNLNCSGIFQSEPWGFSADMPFLNIAVGVETNFTPKELLACCASIEKELGRVRSPLGIYISRTIDVDILYYDDLVMNSTELTIPHKLMHERNFVLFPLAQIAPHKIHPLLGEDTLELLDKCPDKLKAVLIDQELFRKENV